MSHSSNLTFGSLFCGCGGFDLGFVKAGFKCKAAFDIDEAALKNYSNYFSHKATQYDLSRNIPSEGVRDIDVVLAGSPCQGFSTAGKREYDDPRNYLLLRAVEIALVINPKVFILENVNGVVAGQHEDYWNKAKELLKYRYQINDLCISAEELGLAQIRKRRILFAWRTNKCLEISLPKKKERTSREVIAGIGESLPNHSPQYFDEESKLGLIARKINPGQKLSNVRGGVRAVHTWHIPEVYGRTNKQERDILEMILKLRRRNRLRDYGDADPVTANAIARELNKSVKNILSSLIRKNYIRKIGKRYDLTHTFNGKYRRLRWDAPAPTVDTRFGNPRYFLHPEENRGLSVREAARIQGFPDDYIFIGPETIQYRLIGNAVPPPIAEELGILARKVLI